MSKLNIPVGISDFEKIRKNAYYYVDKSELISNLLNENPAEVTLITRPRRFGKTLGMSMLAYFFDIRKDSRSLFDGLKITKNSILCRKWMNQWPVIFFSLKDIDGLTFQSAYGQLLIQISNLYKEFTFLLDSNDIDQDDKNIFLQLKAGRANEPQVSRALSTLMRMLQKYYQKPVILLLDEYDVPIAKASSHGYYEKMLELTRVMLGTALKDNSSLHFAVITGCLKIAKESIFTGTKNFVSDTITDSRLNEYFGFTQNEVDQILRDADLESLRENVKTWYDGYRFGNFDIYCPWDVMNFLRDAQRNSEIKMISYWKNTSDNSIIRSFIDYAGGNITKKLETLLAGDFIIQPVDENLTYDYLHSSEDNLWSILYLTGYLTRVRDTDFSEPLPAGTLALKIPNEEIRGIYETVIRKWFDDHAAACDRKALFDAVWEGDSEKITQEMSRLLRKTISYHDYKEDFYHAFLAGIFAGAGYVVESNKEHGEGRSDVVIYDSVNGSVAVFEAKYSRVLAQMNEDCDRALQQIDEQMYAKEYEDEYDHILCYGISFFKKRCLVKRK